MKNKTVIITAKRWRKNSQRRLLCYENRSEYRVLEEKKEIEQFVTRELKKMGGLF